MAFVETEAYGKQPFPRTGTFRGGVGAWPADFKAQLHSHTDAVEIFYFPLGRCKFVTAGGKSLMAGPRQLVYAPDHCPHILEGTGEGPIPHFLIVAPNRYPTHTFPPFEPEHEKLELEVIDIKPGAVVPESPGFRCDIVQLEPGRSTRPQRVPNGDEIVYVVEGRARVRVGGLEGVLEADMAQFIAPGVVREIESLGPEPLLFMRCAMPNVQPEAVGA